MFIIGALEFVGTFIFIRILARLLRKEIPIPTEKLGQAEFTLIRTAFPVSIGILLLLFKFLLGSVWISTGAIWASLALDILMTAAVLPYFLTLIRLRTNPGAVRSLVSRGGSWSSAFNRFNGWFGIFLARQSSIAIAPADMRRYLNDDIRLLDEASSKSSLSLLWKDLRQFYGSIGTDDPEIKAQVKEARSLTRIPHLRYLDLHTLLGEMSDQLGAKEDAIKKTSEHLYDKLKPSRKLRGTDYTQGLNRFLNCRLSPVLWQASINLCKSPPRAIALSWKEFHVQETFRLRLVLLFNTFELIQRLVGVIILTAVRDHGYLQQIVLGENEIQSQKFPPRSFGDWNYWIEICLKSVGTTNGVCNIPELEPFRKRLLSQQFVLDSALVLLDPFRQIGFYVKESVDHTLDAWSILGGLRNRLIGHGGIGSSISINPRLYLGALHQYFLTVVCEVAELDLSVFAVRDHRKSEVVGKDQGIYPIGIFDEECVPAFRFSDNEAAMDLRPYLRFGGGRLQILDRRHRENKEEITQYVDFETPSIADPSYHREKGLEFSEFIRPRSSIKLSFGKSFHESETRADLSPWMLLTRASERLDSESYEDSLLDADEAISAFRRGADLEQLSKGLLFKGAALAGLNRREEALASYREALRVRAKLVGNGTDKASKFRPIVRGQIGRLLLELSNPEEALSFLNLSADEWEKLAADGEADFEKNLVPVLLRKAEAAEALGDYNQCYYAYDRIITGRETLIGNGRSDLLKYHAFVTAAKAKTLVMLNCLDEALSAYDAAIGIYQRLVEADGQDELSEDLVRALLGKEEVLEVLRQHAEASSVYDEIIKVRTRETGKVRTDLLKYHALVLIRNGDLLVKLHRLEDAVRMYREAIEIYYGLGIVDRAHLEESLAPLLLALENSLTELGRADEIAEIYQSVGIRKSRIAHGRETILRRHGMNLVSRAEGFVEAGQLHDAVSKYEEAIEIWEKLIGEGSSDLLDELTDLKSKKARVLELLDGHDASDQYEGRIN